MSIKSVPEGAVPEPLRPRDLLEVLHRHGVVFVVIGGFAAVMYGSPYLTNDLDITPRTDEENFARLSDALSELEARVRAHGIEPLVFSHNARSLLDASRWNLSTKFGDLDITTTPSGTRGYDDLRRDAVTIQLGGLDVAFASLADVVRSKAAANRDKDRLVLPVLRELLGQQTLARAEERKRGER